MDDIKGKFVKETGGSVWGGVRLEKGRREVEGRQEGRVGEGRGKLHNNWLMQGNLWVTSPQLILYYILTRVAHSTLSNLSEINYSQNRKSKTAKIDQRGRLIFTLILKFRRKNRDKSSIHSKITFFNTFNRHSQILHDPAFLKRTFRNVG